MMEMEVEREENEEKRGCRKGCRRGCLLGCLGVILIAIVTVVAVYLNRERLTNFMFDKTEEAVLSIASEDVDKEEIEGLVAEVREALKAGKFDPETLEKAGRELRKDMADRKLEKEEVDKLIKMFREAMETKE